MIIQDLDIEHIPSTYKLVYETIFSLPTYTKAGSEEQVLTFTPDRLREHINNGDRLNIIVTNDENVVGFLFGIIERLQNSNVFYLEWTGVTPLYRNKGVMQSMWNRMDMWSRNNGLEGILVDTLTNNQKMIRFLQKNNMNIWTELKNHWYGQDYFLWGKLYNFEETYL